MSDDLFTVSVPDDALEAPAFELMPTGAYRSTLQGGARVDETNGWRRLHLPFRGFASAKLGKEFGAKTLEARFPVEAPAGAAEGAVKAASIGQQAVIGAAAALGLTESVQAADGKTHQKLVANSYDELVAQFNAMAGTDVEVYVVAKPRMRNNAPVLRQDGTGPVMDNEIRNVRALAATNGGAA